MIDRDEIEELARLVAPYAARLYVDQLVKALLKAGYHKASREREHVIGELECLTEERIINGDDPEFGVERGAPSWVAPAVATIRALPDEKVST